ncbi:uncharacterized protein LOC135692087 isoform X2 [Rhopilema esculentum]|uniref:uncharacterized protein LOC135692087 isoform X2 n=1 Tax=Rhopilema esculentum TaxID=499914 RepID=UPI0031D008A2
MDIENEMLLERLAGGLAIIGLKDCDYWNFLEGFLTSTKIEKGLPSPIRNIISIIQQSDKVHTSTGRGRLFIRIALVKDCLAATIEYLLQNPKYIRYWYNDEAAFLDKNHTECIIGIIKTLSHIKFSLRVTVCSFLHEDWIIPKTMKLDLVPSEKLGVTVFSIQSKCVVAAVQPGSVANESGLAPGDCFDEFCGIFITERLACQMSAILKANKGQPICAVIIKGTFSDGRWFSPLQRRFKLTDLSKIDLPIAKSETEKDILESRSRSKFDVVYISSVDVGKNGSSKIVQNGIKKALEEINGVESTSQEATITLLERDILMAKRKSGESIGKYSYTETSSCGLGEDKSYFGFITGDTTCSFASKFVCHVFRATDPEMAQDIITGIGRGFNRTLYCV